MLICRQFKIIFVNRLRNLKMNMYNFFLESGVTNEKLEQSKFDMQIPGSIEAEKENKINDVQDQFLGFSCR